MYFQSVSADIKGSRFIKPKTMVQSGQTEGLNLNTVTQKKVKVASGPVTKTSYRHLRSVTSKTNEGYVEFLLEFNTEKKFRHTQVSYWRIPYTEKISIIMNNISFNLCCEASYYNSIRGNFY